MDRLQKSRHKACAGTYTIIFKPQLADKNKNGDIQLPGTEHYTSHWMFAHGITSPLYKDE